MPRHLAAFALALLLAPLLGQAQAADSALNKIKTIVETAGGQFRHIVKITRYLKDISDQDRLNEVVHEYFGENLPCSTTVQVAGFVVPTMKLEFDCWAVIPDGEDV